MVRREVGLLVARTLHNICTTVDQDRKLDYFGLREEDLKLLLKRISPWKSPDEADKKISLERIKFIMTNWQQYVAAWTC